MTATEMDQPVCEPVDAHATAIAPHKATVECQVCYDRVPVDTTVRKICGKACPAVLCRVCLEGYLNTRLHTQIRGVLTKLPCPICIKPVNLVRWKRRVPFVFMEAVLDNYAYYVEAACEILCPECHEVSTVLPDAQEHVYSVPMTKRYKDHIPALRAKCAAFCQHQVSAADLVTFIHTAFAGYSDVVMESVVPLIHDTERRVTLVLYILHRDPFTYTACCDAPVCFRCKVAGHHEDQECTTLLPDVDEMAECPDCGVFLVKGDGCNSMTCVCGACFEWDEEVVRFQMQSLAPRHVRALQRVAHYLHARVWKSRYDLCVDELWYGYIEMKLRVPQTTRGFKQLWKHFKRYTDSSYLSTTPAPTTATAAAPMVRELHLPPSSLKLEKAC